MSLLLRDAAAGFVLKILGTLFLFLLTMYISRMLGALVLGQFSLLLSWLLPISLLARLGLDSNLLRLVSQALAQTPTLRTMALYYQSLTLVMSTAGLFMVVLFLSRGFIPEPYLALTNCLMLVVPLHALLMLNVFYMRGRHRVIPAAMYENALPYLLIFLVVVLWHQIYGDVDVLFAAALGMAVATLVSVLHFCREPAEPGIFLPKISDRLKESLPMLGTSLTTIAFITLDVIVLSRFVGYQELGYYTAAAKLAGFVGFPLMAMISVVGPRLAATIAVGDHERLKQTYQQSTSLAVWAGMPILLVLLLFPDVLLSLFGDGFLVAGHVLQILLVGQVANMLVGPVGYLLWMAGYAVQMQMLMFLSLIIFIVAGLILGSSMGMEGVAIAVSMALILKGGGCWWLVRTRLGFTPFFSITVKPF